MRPTSSADASIRPAPIARSVLRVTTAALRAMAARAARSNLAALRQLLLEILDGGGELRHVGLATRSGVATPEHIAELEHRRVMLAVGVAFGRLSAARHLLDGGARRFECLLASDQVGLAIGDCWTDTSQGDGRREQRRQHPSKHRPLP